MNFSRLSSFLPAALVLLGTAQLAGAQSDPIRIGAIYIFSGVASAFSVWPEPGPRVLRMDAFLIDHVLDKRDWLVPTRTVFRSAPRVRLIVFLRDSQSDELVDSVGLTLAPHGSRLMKDSPGFFWHYMRIVFDRIATRVRWALEDGVPQS